MTDMTPNWGNWYVYQSSSTNGETIWMVIYRSWEQRGRTIEAPSHKYWRKARES